LKEDAERDTTPGIVFVRAHAPALFVVFSLYVLDIGLEPFKNFGFEAIGLELSKSPFTLGKRNVFINQILPVFGGAIVIAFTILNVVNCQDDTAGVFPLPNLSRSTNNGCEGETSFEFQGRSIEPFGMLGFESNPSPGHQVGRSFILRVTFAHTGFLAPLELLFQPQAEGREEKAQECGNPDAEQTTINAGNHRLNW